MLNEDKIELSGIEQAAYWWTDRLMFLTRYFAKTYERKGSMSKNEIKFLSIFFNYNDQDWRNLYLNLTKFITEDVNNYMPTGDCYNPDAFSQDTDIGRHSRLNAELAKITGVHGFPDIRLASNSRKDEVIYTNMSGSSVWYKSCGISPLDQSYAPTYIISGDETELNMYNHLLSCFISLQKNGVRDINNNLLRNLLCDKYKNNILLDTNMDEIVNLYNKCHNIAYNRDIVWGNFWRPTSSPNTIEYDAAGLDEKCLDFGMLIANLYSYLKKENKEGGVDSSSPEDTICKKF